MNERARLAALVSAPVAAAVLVGVALHLLDAVHARVEAEIAPRIGDWRETDWPFERDQFGPGKAYDCDLTVCRGGLRIAFRAKIGFCDCARGVADDEELDRVSDVAIVAPEMAPGPPGQAIDVAGLKGRARLYSRPGDSEDALALAFSHRCDVIVATATGAGAAAGESWVLDFLRSAPAQAWTRATLGM